MSEYDEWDDMDEKEEEVKKGLSFWTKYFSSKNGEPKFEYTKNDLLFVALFVGGFFVVAIVLVLLFF